jgi:broad-specificity NMP kinase
MGMRNYLIEGVYGTGKTSVCKELQRRGNYAINGDTELAYQGDPETGKPRDGSAHEHHIWHADKVKALVANEDEAVAFFCGGSRNFPEFIDLFEWRVCP